TVTATSDYGSVAATHSVIIPLFENLGSLGLEATDYSAAAWGDYDNDGDLDVVLCGITASGARVARIYRNDGGAFVNIGASLPGVSAGAVAWGDYDSDGDLDLALAGSLGTGTTARLYRNDGGTFVNANAGLQGVAFAAAAWGDYDADGDPDLLVSGGDVNGYNPVTKLYRNNGNGTFTAVSAGLPAFSYGDVAWGDHDNDGDLDVLLAGVTDPNAGTSIARIYRNNGNGTFSDVSAGLQGVLWSSVAWGDYDSDGDLDVLLAGRIGKDGARVAYVYRNDGGSFVNINAGLPGVNAGGIGWGDYDNDGDLDILLSGGTGSQSIARVYRNDAGTFTDIGAGLAGVIAADAAWGDYDSDGDLDILITGNAGSQRIVRIYRNNIDAANSPPSAPDGLTASVQACKVTLSWAAAADAQTPAGSLTYNLRVGRTPGGVDVLSPMADVASGRRRLPRLGNANHGLTATLTLPAGTYYWSVQAIDTAFVGGPFAAEGSFSTIPPPSGVAISGPLTGEVGVAYTFTATVSPANTGLPITYTWQATGQEPIVRQVSGVVDVVSYTWSAWGTKQITVTATNAQGTVSAAHTTRLPAFDEMGGLGLEAVDHSDAAWGDYDSDGDLDLLLAGQTASGERVTRVYRNDGGSFVDINAGLPGIQDGAVAWADFDRDGDLDAVIVGSEVLRVCRNNDGTFGTSSGGPSYLKYASAAWGDYDNDGDPDLLISGDNWPFSITTLLYRNDGAVFNNSGATLPGVSYSAAAWGDYDSDGDLDLLLAGYTGSSTIASIYRNDGNAVFTDINAGLQGVLWASVAWGDYDNDGDLDVLLAGKTGPQGVPVARVYRNDGGAFVDIGAGLSGGSGGSAAWGDYDNDGDLDILLAGATGGPLVARIYRNDGGVFVDLDVGLPGLTYGVALWGDYDNDGDLDVLLSGSTGSERITSIYRNPAANANTPPGAPGELVASAGLGSVRLSWSAAADAETPPTGLTYNVRVGRTEGGADMVPPMADLASGWRRLPALGNANHRLTTTLALPPGSYYWSVQAIDGAFAGGPFGAEGRFTVLSGPAQVVVTGTTACGLNVAEVFTASVSPVTTGVPLTYTWEATDQPPLTHPAVEALTDTATFTWTLPGPKTITVTATNALGAATGTHSLLACAPPEAGFVVTPTAGLVPLIVTFTNTTTGVYTASLWDFGDLITSTLDSPTHTYTVADVYTVTLTATGPGGSDTEIRSACISAQGPPIPEPGPHRTDLHLQNLGAGQAAINLVYGTPGAPRTRRSPRS
ncbi:MAG: FG-GAP-like repeat-containing protein, partial [Anaerolineae bacterium]|nr:FG-GAP-like repeat-containing protein [Anaerolineae bacterium]